MLTLTSPQGEMRHALLKKIGDIQCCRLEVSSLDGDVTVIRNGEGSFIVADGNAIEMGYAEGMQNAAFDKVLAEFNPGEESANSYSMHPLPGMPGAVAVDYMYDASVVAANSAVLGNANPAYRDRLVASSPIGREYYVDTTTNALIGESDITPTGISSGFQTTFNDPKTTDSLDDSLFIVPASMKRVKVDSVEDLRRVVSRGRHP